MSGKTVFACTKCSPDEPGGFCQGCRTACHGDHLEHVIDLYSQRNFRCDCGNAKMSNQCKLSPDKPTQSASGNLAVYNHNFLGRYCRCDRKYDPSHGDMIQCAICEDWFHETCCKLPAEQKTESDMNAIELTCSGCVKRLPFLKNYLPGRDLFCLPARCPALRWIPLRTATSFGRRGSGRNIVGAINAPPCTLGCNAASSLTGKISLVALTVG